ncbi:FadR/GntR family transcriptional regulator [Rarobacter faecitabidus]
MIADGVWPVGSRIPTETELTELLGLGRNTVREAVQSLVHAGLLLKRQGSGTYVISKDELSAALNRRIGGAEYLESLEVRRAIEVEAVWLAAQRHTDEDAETLRSIERRRRATLAAVVPGETIATEELVESDVALHRALVAASHNSLLASIYENLVDAIQANVQASLDVALQSPSQVENVQHDHDELVDAVLRRDGFGAINAIHHVFQAFFDAPSRPVVGQDNSGRV